MGFFCDQNMILRGKWPIRSTRGETGQRTFHEGQQASPRRLPTYKTAAAAPSRNCTALKIH